MKQSDIFRPGLGLLLAVGLFSMASALAMEVETVTRVSINADGTQGNNSSYGGAVSDDGRYVVFESSATNLVSDDTNGVRDIFLKDLTLGTLTLISRADGLTGSVSNGASTNAVISGDGKYIVFESSATNIAAGDTNGKSDIFIRNLETNETDLMSVSAAGVRADGDSNRPSISDDGRYVVYDSAATNLVSGDTNGLRDVFVADIEAETVTRVSLNGSTQGNGNSQYPKMSDDGRYVVFESISTNLISVDTNGQSDVFVYDQTAGSLQLVSKDASGVQGDNASFYGDISNDGQRVVFLSYATNLVSNTDTNNTYDVFLKDLSDGSVKLLTQSTSGAAATGGGYASRIAGDGGYVSFYSGAEDLIEGDTNEVGDVFVYDVLNERLSLGSKTTEGTIGDAYSYASSISDDGTVLVFYSGARNLISDDTNYMYDVFLSELELPQPDLTVSDLAYNEEAGIFQYTVHNGGDSRIVETATVNISVEISPEGTGSYTLTDDASADNDGFFEEDGTSLLEYIYPLDTGTYTIEFCADADGTVDESNETNNCDSLEVTIDPPPMPDLRVTDFEYDRGTETLSYTLINEGTADLSDSLTSLETSFSLTYSDDSLRITGEDSLAEAPDFGVMGGSSTIDTILAIEDGTYTLEVCVDSEVQVEELDETDNCLSGELVVSEASEASETSEESNAEADDNATEENATDDTDDTPDDNDETTGEDNDSDEENDTPLADRGDDDLECENPFTDTVGHWAEKAICLLYMQGVVQGIGEGLYSPDAQVTRAEFLKMILVNAGEEVDALLVEPTMAYSDVSEGDWFYGYVMHGSNLGVVGGYDDGTFRPNNLVNRAEALVMLLRMAAVEIVGSETSFTDIVGDEWFAETVGMAVDLGLVEGYEEDNTFRPAGYMTRAEAATIIRRAWYVWYNQ